MARAIWRSLLVHCMRRADSRADWTAGSSRATKTPMMAMTTSSSTSLKARIRAGVHAFVSLDELGFIGGRSCVKDSMTARRAVVSVSGEWRVGYLYGVRTWRKHLGTLLVVFCGAVSAKWV